MRVERAGRLDAPQNFRPQQHGGSRKRILVQEFHRGHLARLGNQVEAHAVLAAMLLEGVERSDDLRDVAHLIGPLADHAAVDGPQVVPILAVVRGRGQQIVHHALEILQAQAGGVHGIGIAHCFGILARIGALRAIGVEAQPGRFLLLARPRVQGFVLVV